MTDRTPDPLDAQVLPMDQRRAADLAAACLDGDGNKVGELLTELLAAGAERTLATTAVLARNLASVMFSQFGTEASHRMLASTRWDAAVAEVDDDPGDSR